MSAGAPDVGNLKSRVLRGFAWSGGSGIVFYVLRFSFSVALARLLTPHEYGLAGMALVFAGLVLGISDLGLGSGLVQRARITEQDRSTVFWTSITIGVALSAVGVAAAGPVAAFFGEPEVKPLFVAVCLGFGITALGRTHAALLQRKMAYRAIALRGLAAAFIAGCIGVSLAWNGYGPWALVGMHLATAVVTTLLLWVSLPWRPRLTFSLHSLRDLGGFGLNVFGTKIIEYLNGNTDKVLVGRFLGSSALGAYNVAYNLIFMPFVSMITGVLDTLFPAFSRVQHDHARIGRAWLRTTQSLVALVAPAAVGLIVTAPDFVPIVLGDHWRGAVPILQALGVAALVHSATALATVVLTSVDRTGTLLRFSIAEVVVITLAITLGLAWGVVGVAAGFAVGLTATRGTLAWIAMRAIATPSRAFVSMFARTMQAVVVMGAVVWSGRVALVDIGVPAGARLPLLMLAGIAVYLPLCAWRSPELLVELRRLRGARGAAD